MRRQSLSKSGSTFVRLGVVSATLLIALIALVGQLSAAEAGKFESANPPGIPRFGFEPNLPILLLDAKGPISADPKVPCTVRLIEPKDLASAGSNSWSGAVKIHGATSQAYPKKSFGIALAAPSRLLDLRESPHWVLNAAFIDRSLMRHKVSYDLFRSLSTKDAGRFAVASRFVEVYLNGNYRGVYLLMERMDRELLQLTPYRSNEVGHACLYKAVDHAANFGRPGHAGYEQREPDPLVKAYWQPLDEFNRFVSSSSSGEFFDAESGIASRLDLENAIDFHLLVLVTCNLDGITKNFNLARNTASTSSPKPHFFFTPWDYDATFGRHWNASPVGASRWLSNHLFDRLMSDRSYRERFSARWKRLREREFSARTIQAMIEANSHVLGEAAHRNAARWRGSNGYYPDALTFEEDVAQMKTWIRARVDWLDRAIQGRAGSAP